MGEIAWRVMQELAVLIRKSMVHLNEIYFDGNLRSLKYFYFR